MNNLLLFEMQELQRNYCTILTAVSTRIFNSDTRSILDEINVFWNRNKRLVHAILQYLSRPYCTYLFTAATILDLDDFEHYPFLCLGEHHIWDDPIYGYIEMVMKSPNEQFNSKVKKQISDTINENITILNSFADKILVLPVRMLSEIGREFTHDAAMQAFLSLFKDNITFEKYKQDYHTIDDVYMNLRNGIDKSIIFDYADDRSMHFCERFIAYKSVAHLPISSDAPDAMIFWFSIYGHLAQAFNILSICSQYQLVPYMRYKVAFEYFLIISSNFRDGEELSTMLYKGVVAHILHNTFEKETYKQVPLDRFLETLRSCKFEQQLFSALADEGITLDTPAIRRTAEIIDQQLHLCLSNI